MIYAREYLAETPQAMTAQETEAVFRAFRDFLVAKGLSPLRYGERIDPNSAAFRIGGTDAGFALRQDWEDLLEITYSGDNEFRLRLIRITHQPADFSEKYLAQFVEQTERFLREATGKPVRLKLIPPQAK